MDPLSYFDFCVCERLIVVFKDMFYQSMLQKLEEDSAVEDRVK